MNLAAHGEMARNDAAPGAQTRSRHVLIIGGGASGVLMAAHLMQHDVPQLRVTLLEARNLLGCGIAYSTSDPEHLLNTRVHHMSAYPQDATHFERWLQARPDGDAVDGQSFVSRTTYGAYLSSLITPLALDDATDLARLDVPDDMTLGCLRRTCVALDERADGVVARLDDGREIHADAAILATGHYLAPPDPRGLISSAWDIVEGLAPDAAVVIVGSGLSMVDQVLSLLKSGHHGKILAVSRRGQLPRGHAPTRPISLSPDELPLGQPISAILHWLRRLAREAEAAGGTWRDAVDGVRPHVTRFWQSMDLDQRARFLRHAVAWWEVHRHRIPPASEARIKAAMDAGILSLRRASFLGAEPGQQKDEVIARLRFHGDHAETAWPCGRIIDCRGIRNDPEANASPLIAGLLRSGTARLDALRLGLDVAEDCRLINRTGEPSRRIRAIGPVSRAAFWEITAIPDIRLQTHALAEALSEELLGAPEVEQISRPRAPAASDDDHGL